MDNLLKLQGVVIPNNSLVDFDDLLYVSIYDLCCNEPPSNDNQERHDQGLLCITDFENCCESLLCGNWYYPSGRIVDFVAEDREIFQANRGQNEVINGRQFYGSVRLFHTNRHRRPLETGYFRCELPSAADSNATQILYVNLVDFGSYAAHTSVLYPVTLSSSGPATGGEIYSLTCSATLFNPVPLPSDIPSPTFEWFFGPSGNAALPSGVTPMATISSNTSTNITYTSTLHFSPLSQSHAGMYTCRLGAGRLANSANVAVNGAYVYTHVYLSLNGAVYANNSIIGITEIGETITTASNTGLQCITDRRPCCFRFEARAGEWYFPNGTTLPPVRSASTFYRNRGDDGTVNLNRLNTGFMSPTGLFCCVVPNSTGIMQRLCANIVPYKSIVIIPSTVDTPTVGETYSLNCFVQTTDPPTYQWFKGQASDGFQLSNVSQLQFSTLKPSDAGLYTCQVTVRGVIMNGTTTVTVKFPVTVTLIPAFVFAGSSPNLTCTVDLSPLVDIAVTVTTALTGPGGFMRIDTAQSVVGSTTTYTSTATVSSIGQDQSGNYTCTVTVGTAASFFAESVGYSSFRVTVVPKFMSLRSDLPNPVLSGSSLTLTCTAELSSVVNISYSVSTMWKGPEGTVITSSATTEMVSFILYTSSTILESVNSGEYSCTMNFGDGVEMFASTSITIVSEPIVNLHSDSPNPVLSGSSLTLTCTAELSSVVNISYPMSTMWKGPEGTVITSSATTEMVSFTLYTSSTILESVNSGEYSCTMNFENGVEVSASISITTAPEPIVSLYFNSPNPVLSGSSLTLTCTAELSSEVNVSKLVSTVWKGPQGTVIASSSATEMKSFTLYTLSNNVHFLRSADSGKYTCTMNFGNGVEVSASTNITIVDAMFQLRLKSVGICHQTYCKDSEHEQYYSNSIKRALIKAIERHCKCHIPLANLLNEDAFICEDSPNLMIYRNALLGTHNFNGTQLLSLLRTGQALDH